MTLRPNFTGLNVFLVSLLVLMLGTSMPIAWAESSVTKDFEGLASRVRTFYTDGFLYNFSPFNSSFPRKPDATANDAQFSLLATRTSEQELEALLKHSDPKVRTLALAALFQKEDPQVMPQIVALADDPAETFPRPGEPAQSGPIENLPTMKQTVGDVAAAMIKFYMELNCYTGSYGFKDAGLQQRFANYWQKRKDRKYCASWFAVELLRAICGGQPPSTDCRTDILRVRHQIDQLSPDDRAWTLLYLRTIYDQDSPDYPNLLVTQDELVKILQQLGSDKLLLVLQRRIATDDPDLSPSMVGDMFLLKHALAFFRTQDADAIIAQGQWETDEAGNGYPMRSAWWWIAAAQLQPDKADDILHQGYDALRKVEKAADALTPLTLALWRSGGEKEAAFLTDWYYLSDTEFARFIHVQLRNDFIDSLVKTARPSDKRFLAHLLQDPRAASIDPETMSHFAIAINGWLPTPIVSPEELDRLSRHHFKGGGGLGPEMVPGLLERLQKSIPQWNS